MRREQRLLHDKESRSYVTGGRCFIQYIPQRLAYKYLLEGIHPKIS